MIVNGDENIMYYVVEHHLVDRVIIFRAPHPGPLGPAVEDKIT